MTYFDTTVKPSYAGAARRTNFNALMQDPTTPFIGREGGNHDSNKFRATDVPLPYFRQPCKLGSKHDTVPF
jgi:hypothetical protein